MKIYYLWTRKSEVSELYINVFVLKFSFCWYTTLKLKTSQLWNQEQEMIFEALVYMTHWSNCHHDSFSNMAKIRYYFLQTIIVNRNWNTTTKVAFLSEIQNLFVWKFLMLFKCVSLWLMICHHATQKMFSHFTLVLESELSSVLEICIRAVWLLDLSIEKKKQPKPIIRTAITVPNVQKCVMVATLTLWVKYKENLKGTFPE